MTRSLKQVVLVLYFLGGVLLGLYLGAVIVEGHAQSDEVSAALANASEHYGVSESWLRRITWCESRWTPWVTSRGGHMGIAQFSGPTWRWMSAQAGWQGASAYDPWAALDVLAWALAHNYAGHWSCR